MFVIVHPELREILMKNIQNLGKKLNSCNLFLIFLYTLNFFFFSNRIFSHPNILPVIGCCNSPPSLIVINQYMSLGSLYTLLHEGTGVIVDVAHTLRFAVDIVRGMAYLHSLERIVPQYQLNSKHIMVSFKNSLFVQIGNIVLYTCIRYEFDFEFFLI